MVGAAVTGWSQETGFYVKGDLGGNLTQDADLKEFFGPVTPGSKVKFDPGFRAGFAGGYQALNWLAGEIELGFMENRVDSITGATHIHDVWYANVPVLFNAKVQIPTQTPFTPYLGAGAGFAESLFDVGKLEIGGTTLHGDSSDTVFAYQAFAGVRYKLNERMGLSVEYRYFVADGSKWEADFTSGTPTDFMRMGRTQTHAISLAFDFHF